MCVYVCVCECVSGGGVRVGCMERMGEGGMRGEGKVRVGCVTVDLDNLSLLLGGHSDTALRDPAEGRRRPGTHCLCMCVNFPPTSRENITLSYSSVLRLRMMTNKCSEFH